MEKCIYCEGVYEIEKSDAILKECYCSLECQIEFEKVMDEEIEFE